MLVQAATPAMYLFYFGKTDAYVIVRTTNMIIKKMLGVTYRMDEQLRIPVHRVTSHASQCLSKARPPFHRGQTRTEQRSLAGGFTGHYQTEIRKRRYTVGGSLPDRGAAEGIAPRLPGS